MGLKRLFVQNNDVYAKETNQEFELVDGEEAIYLASDVDALLERAAAMLKHVGCNDPNCDGNGVTRDPAGDPAPCQWCDERLSLLRAMEGE